ncbi:MAG: ATP phosphoribosyltransferase [Proteobacteria bacterium]|nr:ATP phosphoribosyltransferase [Pseudomonadota bacterium]
MTSDSKLIFALPKGRILTAITPILKRAGLVPEAGFFDENDRRLRFSTSDKGLDIIRVRSFDVAHFIAYGAAQIGITGSDVLLETAHSDIYAPVDLKAGTCRLVVAMPGDMAETEANTQNQNQHDNGSVRVATKYPRLTTSHFAARGIQAECIILGGAMEIAPSLGLCPRIVDLVDSGATLRANNLVEVEEIATISSKLIVNRLAWKTQPQAIGAWIDRFQKAVA